MAEVIWQCTDISLSIGKQVIFDSASLAVHENERVALVGRNGCGKSTLLDIICGRNIPPAGSINRRRDLRVGILRQDFLLTPEITVREVLLEGTGFFQSLIKRYESLPPGSNEASHIENLLNYHDAWHLQPRIDAVSDALHLPHLDSRISLLSGGEQRRVALAAAVISEPDLLLLDEPTNHLDIGAIEWIEEYLARYRGACLFVTHDRYFLDRIAHRVIELDNGKFFSSDGGYAEFLHQKSEREYRADALESKRQRFLRSEIDWVRRSPKARLKRNLGRLKRFQEVSAVSSPVKTGEIKPILLPPARLGDRCLELSGLQAGFGERILFDAFDLEITPGMKLGIVGNNGTGKSTLLSIISGQTPPISGSVKTAPAVEMNYIDQHRVALDNSKTVYEEISGGVDYITTPEGRVSVREYLRRYLFEDDRINTRIQYLSGGEKARLILAKQFKEGGNLLIIDEPTNDLDLSSLRMLEESIENFPGTVIVVSHDRYFINRVCDAVLGFHNGKAVFSLGGYEEYQAKIKQLFPENETAVKENKTIPEKTVQPKNKPKSGLTFRENRELENLEKEIPELEEKIAAMETVFSQPDFYARHGKEQPQMQKELDFLREILDKSIDRWAELAEKRDH